MNVKYVKNNQFYLIANHAVAKNEIFNKKYFRIRLRKKVNIYLNPVCEIISMSIHKNQFQLIVKLASRDSFIRYYKSRPRYKLKKDKLIPESTYIFSQVMANLQASIAIHFNRKLDRTGAVFARRFTKTKISNDSELKFWLDRFKNKIKFHRYYGEWKANSWRIRKNSRNKVNNGPAFTRIRSDLQGQIKKSKNLASKLDNPKLKKPNSPNSS